jgi:hypothetical protein
MTATLTQSTTVTPFALVFEDGRWVVISVATGGHAYFDGNGGLMDSTDKEWALSYLGYANDFPRAVVVAPNAVERQAIAEEHERFVRGLAEILAA